jgi:hypothetical protein
LGDEVKKYLVPAGAALAALGVVGGVAATQAFHPVAKPAQVRLVQPAAQTITVAPSPTTTTPVPVKTTAATPKVVKPAPVQSTQVVAPAPRTVQKAAVVSSDTTSSAPAPDPTPAPAQTTGVSVQATPGQTVPPVIPANVPPASGPSPKTS